MDLAARMSSSICCRRALMSTGKGSLPPGRQLLFQSVPHEGRNQAGDVSAELDDFLDQGRRQVGPLWAGWDEEGLDPGHAVVHLGHLELEVEVRDGPQTLHDDVDPRRWANST